MLGKALRFDPANVATRNQYALALTQNGKAADAAEQYKQARQFQADTDRFRELVNGPLRTSSASAALFHEIGIIALRAGQTREALRWFERGLAVDPDHLPTHRTLTVIYQELDNPGPAARHRAIAQKLTAQHRKP
jgi:Tfp pilus assembly protein PilF